MRGPLTLPEIQKVVREIAEKFRPRRVILFGSHAYGTPDSDSDVDLLIEMDTPLRSVEQAVAIRQAVDFPFPTDLLVRTPQQVAERIQMGDPFFKEILSRGKVLYEADHEGMLDKAEQDYQVVVFLQESGLPAHDASRGDCFGTPCPPRGEKPPRPRRERRLGRKAPSGRGPRGRGLGAAGSQ
ncbi:MAG: nucleotidyltransferase family protein [Anaerolineae bacterium]